MNLKVISIFNNKNYQHNNGSSRNLRKNSGIDNMEVFKKRLLDVKSAADYLSISRAKLYQWVDAGKIPSVRIDGRRLFDILELNEFVERLKRDRWN